MSMKKNGGEGIHSSPCSNTNDVIDMLPQQLRVHTDVNLTSLMFHSGKVLSSKVGDSVVTMVTDLWLYLTYYSRGAWHTKYAMLLSNYK